MKFSKSNNKQKNTTHEIIQQKFKNIKFVVHLADIHIHKREREDEYRKVFNNLYDDLKKQKLNNKNSVIVVCGDVIHDKIDLHPISVSLTRDFFVLLCEITDVIVISGNHDISLSNIEHNSLYSIIGKNLNTKNDLFMLLDNGLYEYNNIIFGHTKFGDALKVQDCKLSTDKFKCALYHGTLSTAMDESGHVYKNDGDNKKYLHPNDFDDYDFVFLGDVHKHAFLKPTIAYPGSLIQQTIDESLNKGYILWDLKKGKGVFKKVHNEFGKIKINIDEKGKYNINLKSMPKYVDVSIECKSMNRDHIDSVYDNIKDYGNITIVKKYDKLVHKNNTFNTKIEIDGETKDLGLLKSKEDVIKLLIDKIKRDGKVEANVLTDIKDMLIEMFKKENFIDTHKKRHVKLISLRFDNMAVYSKNNFVDFSKFKKIVGISAPNSAGKSAFIDCILQSIFGECTRGVRSDMININAKSYSSEVILDVNGVQYKITRTANRGSENKLKKGAGEKVHLFENNKNISGGNISDTKKIIQEKIGTIFDFLITCIVTQKACSQGKCIGFAELSSRDKRDLLCKIARLDIFDNLLNICVSDSLSLSHQLAKYNKNMQVYKKFGADKDEISANVKKQLTELEKNINETTLDNKKKSQDREFLQKEMSKLETTVTMLNDKIKEIEEFDVDDYDDLDSLIHDLQSSISEETAKIKKLNTDLKKYCKYRDNIGDVENIEKEFIRNNKMEINKLKLKIKEQRKLIWNDSTYDYSKYNKIKIHKQKALFESGITELEKQIDCANLEISKNKKVAHKKVVEVSQHEVDLFNKKEREYHSKTESLAEIQENLDNYNDKFKLIENHEYDPDCEYCMKNNITHEKIYLQTRLHDCEDKITALGEQLTLCKKYMEDNKSVVQKYNKYLKDITNREKATNEIKMLEKDVNLYNQKLYSSQKELKNLNTIIDNYAKYIKNSDIVEESETLEHAIDELNNKTCDEVVKYNELKKNIDTTEMAIKKQETLIDKKNNELDRTLFRKKEYDAKQAEINKLKQLMIDKKTHECALQKNKKELSQIISKMRSNEDKLKKMQKDFTELKQSQAIFELLFKDIKVIEKKKDNYNILTQVLKNNGIVDSIMTQNLLPRFNAIVSDLFNKFGARHVRMEYTGTDIIIRDEHNVDTIRDGGYQTYLNNLIYRIALSQLNNYISTNFMIIDEAFDSADTVNKQHVKKLIEYVRSQNDWMLIVSHDDDIKDLFECILSIQDIGDKERRIVFEK